MYYYVYYPARLYVYLYVVVLLYTRSGSDWPIRSMIRLGSTLCGVHQEKVARGMKNVYRQRREDGCQGWLQWVIEKPVDEVDGSRSVGGGVVLQ